VDVKFPHKCHKIPFLNLEVRSQNLDFTMIVCMLCMYTEASCAGVSVCAPTRRARQRQNTSGCRELSQDSTSKSGGEKLNFTRLCVCYVQQMVWVFILEHEKPSRSKMLVGVKFPHSHHRMPLLSLVVSN